MKMKIISIVLVATLFIGLLPQSASAYWWDDSGAVWVSGVSSVTGSPWACQVSVRGTGDNSWKVVEAEDEHYYFGWGCGNWVNGFKVGDVVIGHVVVESIISGRRECYTEPVRIERSWWSTNNVSVKCDLY